jgi:serine/threonine protein phosphatase 1
MIAVIGDIHGCYYTLIELYDLVKIKYPEIEIYSVGDFYDRGKHSLKVVDFIKEKSIKFTPGNHDYMFWHFFEKPSSVFSQTWAYNDSGPVLASYEEYENKVWEHIELIKNKPLYYNLDDCFITHAGFSSHYKKYVTNADDKYQMITEIIEESYPYDHGVMWNRDKLLNIGKLQVVGHTIKKKVEFDKKANALYIDTGAFLGNKLTAVVVSKNEYIDEISVNTKSEDLY